MRRYLGIIVPLALVAGIGCSNKTSTFDPQDTTAGNGAGNGAGTGTTTGSGNTTGSSSSTGSSGSTGSDFDAGPCPDLTGATLQVFSFPSSLDLAGSSGTHNSDTFAVIAKLGGINAVGCVVTFSEAAGDPPVSFAQSGIVDATGSASTLLAAGSQPGIAHVTASLGAAQAQIAITLGNQSVTDAGSPVPSSISWSANNPAILGIAGSGRNEQGTMTFLVKDQLNNPLQGVSVSFAEQGAQLVTIVTTTVQTDSSGTATVSLQSLGTVGVAEIVATVLDSAGQPTSISTSHSIPVRGAKPSATNFYFDCDQHNLPVYTTSPRLERVTCHVHLSDRFNNRVGVPTDVTFHTESGAISASVTTTAFDATNPAAEGTADVVFTSDLGAGFSPADVVPLINPADGGHIEPQKTTTVGTQTVVVNPRDQLVTLIAITQGEEAFFDANGDNQFNAADGDTFVDLGDPFIDSNDDNLFDTVNPGGASEQRFCGSQNVSPGGACPGASYSYGNGKWDQDATIWTSTHLMFSGLAQMSNIDTFGNITTTGCIPAGGSVSLELFSYDSSFNRPAPGATFSAALIGTPTGLSLTSQLSGPIDDTFGSVNVSFQQVAESDGGACTSGNGAACVVHTVIGQFDDGSTGFITLGDTNTTPGSCNVYGVQTTVLNAHQVTVNGVLSNPGSFQ